MIQELLEDAELRMDQAIEHMSSEFGTVRTGRANPQILHRIQVDYYGTKTPLQQLATFSVPEPRLLVVQPFDKGSMGDIEKAILESDRHVRQNTKKHMEDLHGEISDDDITRGEKTLQDLTDRHTSRIDDLLSDKEKELLEV